MTIASGIFKALTIKKQSGLGAPSSGSGGTALPRTTSTLDLKKASYESNTIKLSQMVSDSRHGIRSVDGTISGELNVGVYQDFESSILRQAWQTAATTGAKSDITAAVTTGAAGTFTRGTGSYLTDGFKIGDVVRWSGFATTGVPNNAHNFFITDLSATVMTGVMLNGVAVGAKAAGDEVTCTLVGKKTYVPQTNHTRDYYSIEHFHSDVNQSELFTDCMLGSMAVKLPATGMATVDFPIMGLNATYGTSQVLTTPTAATEGGIIAAVNGALYIAGTPVALITGLDFTVNGNVTAPGGVVASNVDPDLFPGKITVSGNASVYFQDATMRTYFVNETEVTLIAVFTTGSEANADFKAYVMPRVKFNSASKDDGEKGQIQTMGFTALENIDGGAGISSLATVISIQDSKVS